MCVKQAGLISSRYICKLMKNKVQGSNFNFSEEEFKAIGEQDFFKPKADGQPPKKKAKDGRLW